MGALTPRRLSKAASPNTSSLVLATYLWHPMPWVARTAAVNPSTPAWARRWAGRRGLLLDIVLSSKDTAPEFLDRYSRDETLATSMLVLIARHPRATAETLVRVARHPSATMPALHSVVCHPATPVEVVEDIVLNAVCTHGANPVEAANLYAAATARPDLPPATLSWLAHNSASNDVLVRVARHALTPEGDAVVAALRAKLAS